MTTIKVTPRSKSIKPIEITTSSYSDFITQLTKKTRLNSSRLRITSLDRKVLNNEDLLQHDEVYVKDLGPQIGWRTVYLIEYFGPILIHYLVYNFVANSPKQYELIYKMNIAHYLKREFENIFVHKFSSSTMPLFNLFKNSFHYWVLGGLLSLMYLDIGNIPVSLGLNNDYLFYGWCFCEFFNAVTHIQLRLLGDKSIRKGLGRQAPQGGFFELLISPNYTMEIYGWVMILLMNPNVFTLVFLMTGATQMYFWSIKKQERYGTKRSFLVPFVF